MHLVVGDEDDEAGVGGIVGHVEEEKDVADDAVEANDTGDDQSVLVAKLPHIGPAEALAVQQLHRLVEVAKGEDTEVVDRHVHAGEDVTHHHQDH